MTRIHQIVFAIGGALCAAHLASAQPGAPSGADLQREAQRTFEVVPGQDGLLLRPLAPATFRSVEITSGAIAIDGVPVTGAELRSRLGDGADLILRLSYLPPAERRALFGTPAVGAGGGAAGPGRDALPPVEAPRPGPPPPSPPAPPRDPLPDRTRELRTSDGRVRLGGGVTVREDEIVTDFVVAIGGSATILGEVRGDVVAVGGDVELGPGAIVTQDVTVVGGALRRDPTSRISGEVREIAPGEFGDWQGWPRGAFSWPQWNWWGRPFSRAFQLGSTLMRVAILCLFVALVVLLARERVERVGRQAAEEPLKASIVGALAFVLSLPLLIITIVTLVITLIGIPLLLLLPFAILFLCALALVGFTGVAQQVGRWLLARLGIPESGPYAAAIAGVLLIVAPIIVGRLVGLVGLPLSPMTFGFGLLGALVESLAWTIGVGAVALVRFGKKKDMGVLLPS
jgi:hypothetical protein